MRWAVCLHRGVREDGNTREAQLTARARHVLCVAGVAPLPRDSAFSRSRQVRVVLRVLSCVLCLFRDFVCSNTMQVLEYVVRLLPCAHK
jgi:hypothetical protein